MTLPHFLLIGAAKAGTVSLYHYLGQHPQIFMSPINEANFFALDGYVLDAHFQGPGDRAAVEQHCIKTLDRYQALFRGAQPGHLLGEVAPLYLYSDHAAKRIHHYLPDVKLIAVLRQPTERAFSNFRHYRAAGIEPLTEFAAALEAEGARRAASWGPWPFWSYYDVGLYPQQLSRYYALFDPAQILVCLYEDLRANPLALLQKLYTFIGVDASFIPDTSVRHNIGSRPRLQGLHRLMTRPNPLKGTARVLLPKSLRTTLGERLRSWNEIRTKLDPALRRHLDERYAAHVEQLQALIGRDLSSWLPREKTG